MGNCCKNCGTNNSRTALKNAPADAPKEPGGYGTAGVDNDVAHTASRGNLLSEEKNFLMDDFGDDPPGAQADEKALDWLNFIVRETWPFVRQALHNLIEKQIMPRVLNEMPTGFKGLHFNRCDLGCVVPVLGPLHVHKKSKQRQPGIEIDCFVDWNCAPDIELELHGIKIGVKQLGVAGKVCLVMRPLMDSIPIIGGVQVFMLSPPRIHWDFTGMGQVADFPMVSETLRQVVRKIATDQIVLPHRIFIHWLMGRENEIDITAMQFPMPEGLIRVCIAEAKGLDGKDWHLFEKATSDPYATVQIGERVNRTPTKKRTLNPKWGDDGWADFFIFSRFQYIHVELFDEDHVSKDFLGRLQDVTLRDLIKKSSSDDPWFTVMSSQDEQQQGHPAGEVRIAVQVFDFEAREELLLSPPKKCGKARTEALLHVQIRSLRGLTPDKSTGSVAVVKIGGQTLKSPGAVYMEARQDFVYDQFTVAIDPAAQRMAEFLSTNDKLPIDQIASISGLHEPSLQKILRERPSFTTRWHHGMNILLDDLSSAELEIELLIPKQGKAPPPKGELRMGLSANELMLKAKLGSSMQIKQKLLSAREMTWEGFLHLVPVKAEGHEPPLDIDIKLSLYGLRSV